MSTEHRLPLPHVQSQPTTPYRSNEKEEAPAGRHVVWRAQRLADQESSTVGLSNHVSSACFIDDLRPFFEYSGSTGYSDGRFASVKASASTQVGVLFNLFNHPNLKCLKLSFEFAKADVVLESTTPSQHDAAVPSDPSASDLAHFIELKNRNDQLRQEAIHVSETLKDGMARARNSEREKLKAALEDAQGRLQLLEAVAQSINDLIEFVQSTRAGQRHAESLDSTIDGLTQAIPELNGEAVRSTTSLLQAVNSRAPGGDSGILGLVSEVSAMNRKLQVVDERIHLTSDLTLSAENLRLSSLASFRVLQ